MGFEGTRVGQVLGKEAMGLVYSRKISDIKKEVEEAVLVEGSMHGKCNEKQDRPQKQVPSTKKHHSSKSPEPEARSNPWDRYASVRKNAW